MQCRRPWMNECPYGVPPFAARSPDERRNSDGFRKAECQGSAVNPCQGAVTSRTQKLSLRMDCIVIKERSNSLGSKLSEQRHRQRGVNVWAIARRDLESLVEFATFRSVFLVFGPLCASRVRRAHGCVSSSSFRRGGCRVNNAAQGDTALA
jgi:hypothetical protein